MVSCVNFLQIFDKYIGSTEFLFATFILFLLFKCIVLFVLIRKGFAFIDKWPAILLVTVVSTAVMTDLSWLVKLSRDIWGLVFANYSVRITFVRVAWACLPIHYQALMLFIDHIIDQDKRLTTYQKICTMVSGAFFIFFLCVAYFNFGHESMTDRPWIEFEGRRLLILYSSIFLHLIGIGIVIKKSRTVKIPRLIKKQLAILLYYIVIPYYLLEFLQQCPFDNSPLWVTNSYTFVALSNILMIVGSFICVRKVMGLRFLNVENHVKTAEKIPFMSSFKEVLRQLGHVTSAEELKHITQNFFKEVFDIPMNRTTLYICGIQERAMARFDRVYGQTEIERIISILDSDVSDYIKQHKILIYDEIVCSDFHAKNGKYTALASFLDEIGADIFLPIYTNNDLMAYVIVARSARPDRFYTDIERDEMLIFGNYLDNIINMLQARGFDVIMLERKELKEELYRKHKEIDQYKESTRYFLRNTRQDTIGIIFYKNSHFTFGNQAAKEMIPINPNMQEGHHLSKALKQIAYYVERFKAPYTVFSKDIEGDSLILAGVPHLEQSQVIITVYYPEISDMLKRHIELLHDPSEWDYLLYLETTESGHLINNLIPGSSKTVLKCKVELLKIALSKKAILLTMPEADLDVTVELLHKISGREKLYTLNLQGPVNPHDMAIRLFGINPIFGVTSSETPLLTVLDGIGTLYIKNIHFLDLETQKYFAEFIRYGFYRIFKSDRKVAANTRIICSTDQDLRSLAEENRFSKELFAELKQASFTVPSLMTLPEGDVKNMAESFCEQVVKDHAFKHMFALNEQDKNRIALTRPSSLHEFKKRVEYILEQKTKRNGIADQETITSLYTADTDEELMHVARLGRRALKDKKILQLLWNKFKNQNQIANFLGVNRSSVNRRCKDFGLCDDALAADEKGQENLP